MATGQLMEPEETDEDLGQKASVFLENPCWQGPVSPLGWAGRLSPCIVALADSWELLPSLRAVADSTSSF